MATQESKHEHHSEHTHHENEHHHEHKQCAQIVVDGLEKIASELKGIKQILIQINNKM